MMNTMQIICCEAWNLWRKQSTQIHQYDLWFISSTKINANKRSLNISGTWGFYLKMFLSHQDLEHLNINMLWKENTLLRVDVLNLMNIQF